MFKNDSHSIQKLLTAEKSSEEKINQARKRKIQRLKEAKEEARKEIEVFRNEKEIDFKDHETKYLGSRDSCAQKIEHETDKSLNDMQKFVKLNQDIVIPYLLEQVFSINSELHPNFRSGVY